MSACNNVDVVFVRCAVFLRGPTCHRGPEASSRSWCNIMMRIAICQNDYRKQPYDSAKSAETLDPIFNMSHHLEWQGLSLRNRVEELA